MYLTFGGHRRFHQRVRPPGGSRPPRPDQPWRARAGDSWSRRSTPRDRGRAGTRSTAPRGAARTARAEAGAPARASPRGSPCDCRAESALCRIPLQTYFALAGHRRSRRPYATFALAVALAATLVGLESAAGADVRSHARRRRNARDGRASLERDPGRAARRRGETRRDARRPELATRGAPADRRGPVRLARRLPRRRPLAGRRPGRAQPFPAADGRGPDPLPRCDPVRRRPGPARVRRCGAARPRQRPPEGRADRASDRRGHRRRYRGRRAVRPDPCGR